VTAASGPHRRGRPPLAAAGVGGPSRSAAAAALAGGAARPWRPVTVLAVLAAEGER